MEVNRGFKIHSGMRYHIENQKLFPQESRDKNKSTVYLFLCITNVFWQSHNFLKTSSKRTGSHLHPHKFTSLSNNIWLYSENRPKQWQQPTLQKLKGYWGETLRVRIHKHGLYALSHLCYYINEDTLLLNACPLNVTITKPQLSPGPESHQNLSTALFTKPKNLQMF